MENKILELDAQIETKKEYNKQLKSLMLKYKDGWKERQTIVQFEQPCCILLRNSFDGEFLESSKRNGLKSTNFIYRHSNGKEMKVDLRGSPLYRLPYGKDTILAYIHHEDWFTPMNDFFSNPHAPIDQFNAKIEHSLSAVNKWEAEKAKAFALNWKYIAFIVLALAVMLAVYLIFKQPEGAQQAATTLQNATIIYNVPT